MDNANGYRHVWVVYDTDDFPAEHIDRVVKLCRENSTEDTEFHAVCQTSVWNYGICFISVICSRIYTGQHIGRN